MSMIYMIHPEHGAMHVYAEAEALANEKNGWARTEVKSESLHAQPIAAPEVPPTLSTKRGPGRPKKE